MEHSPIKVGDKKITNSKCEKLSRIEIDKKNSILMNMSSQCVEKLAKNKHSKSGVYYEL